MSIWALLFRLYTCSFIVCSMLILEDDTLTEIAPKKRIDTQIDILDDTKKILSLKPRIAGYLNGVGENDVTYVGESLNKQQCLIKYGRIKFFKDKDKRLPPLLYTFPGSGNTWGRLLIEYATGIYSGSVYNDKVSQHTKFAA